MANINVIRTIRIQGESVGVEKLTGDLKKLVDAQKGVAVVGDELGRSQLSLAQKYKQQTMQLDENARMQNRIAAATKIADGALREGLITQQQHAERLNLITQRYAAATVQAGKFAGQTGLNRYEMLNFSRQIQDVIVSLAGGQSPFVVATQQGSQFLDIAQQTNGTMRGFFQQIVNGASTIITPFRAVAAVIGTVAVSGASAANSWVSSQAEVEKGLSGTGRAARLQATDINQLAKETSSWGTISQREARTAAAAFANAGVTTRENIASANNVVLGFAKTLGVDLDEGVKILAKGLTSGIAGVDELGKRLGGLTGAQREYLATLDASTDKTKLQAAALQFVAENTRQAAELMTPLGRLGLAAGNALSNVWDDYGSVADGGSAIDVINKQIQALEKARDTAQGGGFDPRFGSTGSAAEDVGKLTDQIGRLRLEATKLEAAGLTVKFSEWGKAALDAAEEFAPLEKAAADLEKRLKLLKEAQGNESLRLTLTPQQNETVDRGTRAVEVKGLITREQADQADRYNQKVLEIAASYQGVGISTALVLRNLESQLSVASAVGQMAQIEAQHREKIVELSQRMSEAEATRVAGAERAVALAQIEAAHKQQMVALQGQLSVAEQVTGIGQINAQYEATVALLTLQIGQTKAIEQAEMGRAIALAQVNAAASQMLTHLQQEGELIRASSAAEQDRIRARQTYQNLVAKGVDGTKAQMVASQQLANAEARRSAAETRAAEQAIASIRTRADAWKAYEAGIISWTAANEEAGNVMRRNTAATEDAVWWYTRLTSSLFSAANAATVAYNAFVPFSTRGVNETPGALAPTGFVTNKSGGRTQFNPEGYKQNVATPAAMIGAQIYGPGGLDPQTGRPNAQGLEYQFNQMVSRSGVTNTIQSLLSTGLTTQGQLGQPAQLDTNKLSLLDRAIGTLPEEMQAAFKQMELQQLSKLPESLARNEAIKTLQQSIEQLTSATNENTSATSAMTDVLSPFYSSDPRRTNLGFRAFGGGGIMTPYGELPINQYAGGGIANSPQVAVFGEGRTPEAYVPVPSGRIPVELRQPANNNQRPIQVTQHLTVIGSPSRDDTRKTEFQMRQAARRALG